MLLVYNACDIIKGFFVVHIAKYILQNLKAITSYSQKKNLKRHCNKLA